MSVFLLDYGHELSYDEFCDQLRGSAGDTTFQGILQYVRNEALGALKDSTDLLVKGETSASQIALARFDSLSQVVAKLHAISRSPTPEPE